MVLFLVIINFPVSATHFISVRIYKWRGGYIVVTSKLLGSHVGAQAKQKDLDSDIYGVDNQKE